MEYCSIRYLVAQKFRFNYVSVVKGTSKDGFTKLWMDVKLNLRWMFDEDTRSQLEMASEIASKNIPRYLESAYGRGKFVKYEKAKRLIQKSRYRKKTKEMLLDFLQIVSSQDLEKAKESYEKDFKECMKRFNELGISPIMIEKGAKVKEMENPLYYIEHKNKNYK